MHFSFQFVLNDQGSIFVKLDEVNSDDLALKDDIE